MRYTFPMNIARGLFVSDVKLVNRGLRSTLSDNSTLVSVKVKMGRT